MILVQDNETTYRWFRSRNFSSNNLDVLIDPRKYKQPTVVPEELTISQVKFDLKLENLTIDDSGWYRCRAKNNIGVDDSRINLTVSYPPRIPSTGTPMFPPHLLVLLTFFHLRVRRSLKN